MNGALEVATWNVWFGQWRRRDRWHALQAELDARHPDVVALQEVTPALLAELEASVGSRPGHWLVADSSIAGGYGVALYGTRPLLDHQRLGLPSQMGRALLSATVETPRGPLTVATVHLESRAGNAPRRLAQLRLIVEALTRHDEVVLMGDMNFAPDSVEQALAVQHFVDAWRACHGDAPGFTVDSDRNLMCEPVREEPVRKRIDRIFVRSARWRPQAMDRLGLAALPDDPLTFASDHFGLALRLSAATT